MTHSSKVIHGFSNDDGRVLASAGNIRAAEFAESWNQFAAHAGRGKAVPVMKSMKYAAGKRNGAWLMTMRRQRRVKLLAGCYFVETVASFAFRYL